jgi:hypothetical protein
VIHRLLAIFILLSLTLLERPNLVAENESSPRDNKIQSNLEEPTRILQDHFLKIIKVADVKGFMKLVPDRGAFLGTDQPRSSRAAIQRSMDHRTDFYCLLFDSECLSQSRAKNGEVHSHVCSYREVLTDPDKISISHTVEPHRGQILAFIDVDVSNYKCSSTGQLMRFVFVRSANDWKLRAIPYP